MTAGSLGPGSRRRHTAERVDIDVPGVGLILFERSPRAKRISISVKPFRGVRVAVPHASSFKTAEEFARSRTEWINRHLERVKRYEGAGDNALESAACLDKKEARVALVARLKRLASRHGFAYNRVSIRNQRTRWGSCSGSNNISLNMKLVRLPDELIDYVILHELTHTLVKNHGQAFWAALDKLVGNGKRLSLRLRDYGREVSAP